MGWTWLISSDISEKILKSGFLESEEQSKSMFLEVFGVWELYRDVPRACVIILQAPRPSGMGFGMIYGGFPFTLYGLDMAGHHKASFP